MKKSSLFIFLMAAVLLVPALAFAAETGAQDSADKTLAASETPSSAPAAELPKDEPEALNEVPVVNEATPAPIATVSDAEKEENPAPKIKAKAVPAKKAASKVTAAMPAKKKAAESHEKTEASSSLSSAELEERWKALFSKEIGPDSIAYTVKPGDSLYVLARKNHTTVDFIKKINGLKSDNIYPKMKLKIHTAPLSIRIDKSKNVLTLYSNDEVVKKYSVATGKKNCTPVGEFKITDKLLNPTWFKTGAILPPGSPENALGTRWMGFDKPSYGIHGTIEPKSMGTQASEGCIRMLNEEVEELYSLVPVGTKITIQD